MVGNVYNGLAAVSSLQTFGSSFNLVNGRYQAPQYSGQIVPFDNNILTDYYATSSLRNPATARSILESQGLAGGNTRAPDPAGTPPWDDPTAAYEAYTKSDADKLQEIMSRTSLLDPGEELEDDTSQSSEAKNLFLLNKASTRIQELADYLSKGAERDTYRQILSAEFDRYVAEFESLVEQANFSSFQITSGFDTDTLSAEKKIIDSGSVSYKASGVKTEWEKDVPDITGTEKFFVDVTKNGTTTSVEIDLSKLVDSAKALSLTNMADLINDELSDAGFGTTFNTETVKVNGEFTDERRFTSILGLNETVSFSAEPADRTSALYVVGSDGYDQYTNGYLTKLEGLQAGSGPTEAWRSNIDTSEGADLQFDDAEAVTTDSSGNIYVVGNTHGNVNGQLNNSATSDVYISKYDSTGREVWSRLLGADDTTKVKDITVDDSGNIVLTGQTSDDLLLTTTGGQIDTFVTKLNTEGLEQWTYQGRVDTFDAGFGVTIDSNGDVLMTGITTDTVADDQIHAGSSDGQILRLDGTSGSVSDAFQFGTPGSDVATAIKADSAGNYYVAGDTDGTGFLRKYDSSNNLLWTQSLGAVTPGTVKGLDIEGTNVYVSGTNSGDGKVWQFADDSTAGWTQTIGGANADTMGKLTVASDAVYISGTTANSLDGVADVSDEKTDSFVARLDITTGNQDWVHQFGGGLENGAKDIVFTEKGSSVLNKLGLAEGISLSNVREGISDYVREFDAAVTTQTGLRPGSSFTIKVGDQVGEGDDDTGGNTVTIEAGDSLRWVAFKINEILGSDGNAKVFRKDGGLAISIQALNGKDIVLGSGPDGFDALKGLDLKETTIFGQTVDPATGEKIKRRGLFSLNLAGEINASSDAKAGDASALYSYAAKKFKDAYEYMLDPINYNDDPLAELEALQKQNDLASGASNAPEYLRNQISGYENALNRLSTYQAPSTAGFFL